VDEQRRAIQPYSLNSEVLELMIVRSSSLTGAGLYRYIRYLQENELDASRYVLAFWERVATSVSVLPMLLLALPFAFTSLRSGSTGSRLLIGVMIGLAYFLLSSTLADGAAVFQVSPVIVAWTPVALLSLAVVILLRRLR
jgi:lipopolysaccharide export system permease protein